jgi:hypothetical protein
MQRTVLIFLLAAGLALASRDSGATALGQQGQPPAAPEKKFPDFEQVVKGAKEYDGLFKLHQKDEHLLAEILPNQFDKPLLCPMAIARGAGLGGYTLDMGDEVVLMFHRSGDKVQVIRRNVHFKARPGSPVAKAVETTYTDSVLLALKIQTINPMKQSVVIDLNDIFMADFAQLGLGLFDPNRSTWHKVKAYPQNLELQVAATFTSAGRGRAMDFGGGGGSVIDPRGTTVVIHYGLVMLPDDGYQPRLADDRVGHFLTAVKDYTSDSRDTSFFRYVNRWRLEKAEVDPKHPEKLSPPKKKIVFWIEKSVPDEYRTYVREGILEWNKAFEKIGFRDAIEVRQQEKDDDFDPEDIRYSTFRWITNDGAFAMGPSRANPLTGEILDADIIFDADMVRIWKHQYQLYGNTGLSLEEIPSLIRASRQGLGLRDPLDQLRQELGGWNEPRQADKGEKADQEAPTERGRQWAVQHGICQCGAHMKYELGMMSMVLAARGELKAGERLPEELLGQAIKEVVMHEVGHTLGLRHNFKASTMLPNDKLHDTNITRKQGLVGSVMDYAPINLAPKGVKQGDYFTTTIGPYDYWAIEYAYKPLSGGTEGEYEKLQEIATRCAGPGLDYGTDEDLFTTADPSVNQWDLGADPMKYAQDRMLLTQELLKDLTDRTVDKGEGYQRTRQAFTMLLNQYGNGAHLIANHIGGEYVNRDHRGDPSGRDPLVPVKSAKQREALKFLQENILNDKPFQFSPQLLRQLAADRWMHWGTNTMSARVEYPLTERILAIQRVVLEHVFDPRVLSRVQNNALKAEKEEQPLTVAEIFRSITDGVWVDLPAKDPKAVKTSVIIRNLQREHLRDLSNLALGNRNVLPDARSLARMHLRDIDKRVKTVLDDNNSAIDDTTRAHLEECHERIAKVLAASMQVSE